MLRLELAPLELPISAPCDLTYMSIHEPRAIWCDVQSMQVQNGAKTVMTNVLLCKRIILLIIYKLFYLLTIKLITRK
jgi:hypothetical protein